MQNLTAHYNILYNANELINESERNIQLAYSDNYDRVITVYKEPDESLSDAEIKNLDLAILKANTIANEKSLSKYVDDAYFLIARANHLKSNFYNAVEYFSYVYNSYPKEKEIRQAALAWKARSLIASERFEEAEATLDTALKNIRTEKKSVADIYATRAQLHIYAQEDEKAITLLEQAVKSAINKQNKIRWIYLTAQLQEINKKPQDALVNYSRVLKSNAPFDMAFNANLSRINIKNELSGDTSSRTRQIAALLKDDKNRDFTDQIYFQIANSYADANNIDKAIENYTISISKSSKNVTQKGLAYLKLAEIYFTKSDFLQSKAYYDSTLIALPPAYPDYQQIKKKADNLELLAERLSVIAREDTLQMLAGLTGTEREKRIDGLVRLQAQKAMGRLEAGSNASSIQLVSGAGGDTKFYFNNAIALNQGLADFKKRWGNRKLEDNWRRSQKSATEISNPLTQDQAVSDNSFQQVSGAAAAENIEALRNSLIQAIPLTGIQKSVSDQKIASALYDIASYYREVSADTAEAVKTYEQLLNRFPENSNKLAVYYNLYRLYQPANPGRSDEYKKILLTQYPDSPFARTISDPGYSRKTDEQEAAFNRFYNEAYNLYINKKYTEVLASIDKYRLQSGTQNFPAQLAYLRSLAIGHTQKLPQLESVFKELVNNYPDDQLIVPLVKQHLAFIDSNRNSMADREVALSDMDLDANRFIEEPVFEQVKISDQTTDAPAVISGIPAAEALKPVISTEGGFFSAEESAEYYFVVNVSDPSVNLSSSRFGIGQFNRVNLPGVAIKHQLKSLSNQNQLIFVGPLSGKNAAADYFNAINPMMRDIMKIPAGKYSTFLISRQNLEKISDKETLDLYIEFYKKNY